MFHTNAIQRILTDIKELNNYPLYKDGIHHLSDENNILNFKALIIGPENTPYYGGFYFFDFEFPHTYPLDPPKVRYCTLDDKIRFNPNLYTNGKVCLSILNTWNGPSWTPCNSISSVLLSILAMVFIDYPLRNEPGYENEGLDRLKQYNHILEHESLRVGIIKMMKYPPKGFEIFQKVMKKLLCLLIQ